MDTSCTRFRDDRAPAPSETASPPVVVVSSLGDVAGSRAAAAALACAGIGDARAPLFIDLAGMPPRPTLLSTPAAQALAERLAESVPSAAAATRGGFCQIALPVGIEGFAMVASAVEVGDGAPAVIHATGDRLTALLEGAFAPRISAALLRSGGGVEQACEAPLVAELLRLGLGVTLLDRRLKWQTERRALFGALRAKDLHELPEWPRQWFAACAREAGGLAGRSSAS
jgi:hypothetical protein